MVVFAHVFCSSGELLCIVWGGFPLAIAAVHIAFAQLIPMVWAQDRLEVNLLASLFFILTSSLRIQFALDARDGGTKVGIDTHFALDFFDGMDGGGVVFPPQFFGDLWEAEV